jgi:molybdopterin-guanine dinucleotide biosynthesis protein A
VTPEDSPENRVGTVGAVLAGGAGRRIGGDKAVVALEGRPLLQWAIDALWPVVDELAVVAKPDTLLPQLDANIALWLESDEGFHPLVGVVHALRCAAGRPVVVIAADMPLLTEGVLRRLAAPAPAGRYGRVARADGRLQPLCARYEASALGALSNFDGDAPATDTVLALGVEVEEFDDALPFFNVNAPEDLLSAGAELRARS